MPKGMRKKGDKLPEVPKPGRRTVSSAGILMYRRGHQKVEVLLVHPGGPYWRKKDEGAWSIPKGEIDEDENAEVAARREFLEETGTAVTGPLEPLGEIRQRGGKRVTAFAVKGDFNVDAIRSNTFEIEWPPKCTPDAIKGLGAIVEGCSPFPRSIAPLGSTCQLRT
jgi:predicted NUDIX family NTP pyrophosphohydrolase